MSELYESCDAEFNKIVDQTDRVLNNFQQLPTEKKQEALNNIQSDLSYAEQQIKQMEIEISSEPINIKQGLLQAIKKKKNEWVQLHKRHIKAEEQFQDQRNKESLMDQKIELSTIEDSNGKEKFLQNGTMMSDGTYKLKGALKELYQVESQSNDIAVTVDGQNKQMDRMIRENSEIYNGVGESNRLVDRIKKNIVKNKLVLYIVIAILIIALIIIIWVNV